MATHAVRWCRSETTHWRRAPGRVVLLPAGAAAPSTLHGTGAALWEVFAVPCTVGEAARVLADRFSAEPERVEADIEPVIAALVEAGALRAVSAR